MNPDEEDRAAARGCLLILAAALASAGFGVMCGTEYGLLMAGALALMCAVVATKPGGGA